MVEGFDQQLCIKLVRQLFFVLAVDAVQLPTSVSTGSDSRWLTGPWLVLKPGSFVAILVANFKTVTIELLWVADVFALGLWLRACGCEDGDDRQKYCLLWNASVGTWSVRSNNFCSVGTASCNCVSVQYSRHFVCCIVSSVLFARVVFIVSIHMSLPAIFLCIILGAKIFVPHSC